MFRGGGRRRREELIDFCGSEGFISGGKGKGKGKGKGVVEKYL